MKNKTIKELKQITRRALEMRYGFAPTLNKINLLESCNNGTYILFNVSSVPYRFDSHLMADGSVWVDGNSVTKL